MEIYSKETLGYSPFHSDSSGKGHVVKKKPKSAGAERKSVKLYITFKEQDSLQRTIIHEKHSLKL